MTVQFARGTSVALFTIFAAQTAWADLTAKDVWAEWQSYMKDAGYEVSATETMSGNTLTIGGLTMNMEMPEGMASVSMGDIALAENGDGTVSVGFPATIPVVFDVKPEGEEPFKGTLNMTQSDAAMVVSGSPQAMTYDYSAAALAIALAHPDLSDVDLTGLQMTLRWERGVRVAWDVEFWAKKKVNPRKTTSIGSLVINAQDGKLIFNQLRKPRLYKD